MHLRNEVDIKKLIGSAIRKNKVVVLMLHSPTCGHCLDSHPHFVQAASTPSKHVVYLDINTRDNELDGLLQELEVKTVPKFVKLYQDYSFEEVEPDERTVHGFLRLDTATSF